MKVKIHNMVIAVFLLIIYLMQITACSSTPTLSGSFPVFNGSLPMYGSRPSLLQSGSTSSQGSTTRTQSGTPAQSASSYWTGDGAKNDSIAILPLAGQGLSGEEERIPVTVQGILVGDMSGFSAMRVVDRMNLEKIIAEGESGYWADERNFAQLGQLANVRYIMNGSIQKTGSGFVLQLRVSEANGTSRAVYTGNCRLEELENQSAVKQASKYLLGQLGVRLTAAGEAALMAPVTEARKQAEDALARGILAQRQGTEVAALSYYFQAATYDPSLLEALNRSSVLNANISSGNIGADVRNDIVWRRNWVQRLTEAEQSFAEFNRTTSMPYTLFYSDEIKQGSVNYRDETVTLSIETNLHPSHTWGRTVAVPMQRTLRAVYDGLQATQRVREWELNSWPNRGVTNLNSFARRNSSFTIEVELLNDQNRVIGKQSFRADGWWEYIFNQNAPSGIRISDDVRRTVNFTVKADDITDRLTIRIASVNGTPGETAARNGILQVRAMPKDEYNWESNNGYQFVLGEIRGYRGNDNRLSIPRTIWGETVVGIGNEAFARKQLVSVVIPNSVTYIGESAFANNRLTSVTIPNSVTIIGDRAFANNHWTVGDNHYGLERVTIPNSITSIGQEAFASHWTTSSYSNGRTYTYNHWLVTEVTIGTNVRLGTNAIGNGFEAFYTSSGMQTGNYNARSTYNGVWYFRTHEQVQADAEKAAERAAFLATPGGKTLYYLGLVAGMAACIAMIILLYKTMPDTEKTY